MEIIMVSIWSKTSDLPRFEALKGDLSVDALIIGGGITGVLCAYMLEREGVDYALVEAGRICGGATKNTTAKITFQHGLIYRKLIDRFGAERARMYLDANAEALEEYRGLCGNIDCDFHEKDAYVYSLDDRRVLEDELAALAKIGYKAEFTDKLPLPFPFAGAVRFKAQAEFDPLKFISSVSQNLNIYENTRVKELTKRGAITDNGRISAKKIIVATHFPFINKHGSYFLKLYQSRSYALALDNAPDMNGMYIDEAENGVSFRNHNDQLLIGGGGHRTGKRGGAWAELERLAAEYYPRSNIVCRWAAQDCMSLDGVPYIGMYSKRTPNFYVATGYNKWGMTASMAAAKLLADMVVERENRFAPVFSPSRSILRPQLAVNAFEAITNLLTISGKRCPHMGCALKWNPQEHSWDCPCHGSRFTRDGKLIDNPATGDLKE